MKDNVESKGAVHKQFDSKDSSIKILHGGSIHLKENLQSDKMKRKELNWLEKISEKRKKENTPQRIHIGKKIDSNMKRNKKTEKKLSTSLKLDKEKITPRKKDRKNNCIENVMKSSCKSVPDIIKKFENSGAIIKEKETEKHIDRKKIESKKESQLSKFGFKSQIEKNKSIEVDSRTKDSKVLMYGAEKNDKGLEKRKSFKEIRSKDTTGKEYKERNDNADNSKQE